MLSISRRFIGVAVVPLATIGLATGAALQTHQVEAATSARGADRPNILLIITDDQRNGLDVMPSVKKRIQNAGTTYTNAFATTPLCCPSRANIFTGKYSHNHNVIDNQHAAQLETQETLQYFLKKAGYRTGIAGKYLNSVRREGPPFFKKYAVLLSKVARRYYYGGRWTISGKGYVDPKAYSTSFIGKWAMRFLRQWDKRDDNRPWFMLVTPTAPHNPATTTPEYENAPVPEFSPVVEKDKSDKPAYVRSASVSPETGQHYREKHLRALMPVDDMIDRLILTLRTLKENPNTIVIYMSDNGFLWGEHGMIRKTVPYTEAVRVPLLVKWPGHISADAEDDRLVGNIDIAPTILDAVGLDAHVEEMDGRSLLDGWNRDRILLEFEGTDTFTGPWASTRTHDYQFIHYDFAPSDNEYYDLISDADQLENLLKDDNPVAPDPLDITQIEAQLEQDRNCSGDSCP